MTDDSAGPPIKVDTSVGPTWKEVFDFVRQENQKDREHLDKTFKTVVHGVVIVVSVSLAAFFYMTYHSLSEARQAVTAETKTQLEREFSSSNLQNLIYSAAVAATKGKLGSAIDEAVRAEMTTIRKQGDEQTERLRKQTDAEIAALRPRRLTQMQGQAIEDFLMKHKDEFRGATLAGGFPGIMYPRGDGEAHGYAQQLTPWIETVHVTNMPDNPSSIPELDRDALAVCYPRTVNSPDPEGYEASKKIAELFQQALHAAGISAPMIESDHCNGGIILVGRKVGSSK